MKVILPEGRFKQAESRGREASEELLEQSRHVRMVLRWRHCRK